MTGPTDRIETPPAAARSSAPGRPDTVLTAATDLARAAAVEVGGSAVGDHLGVRAETERVVTHAFTATLPGYVGWHWAVTLARVPRSRIPTVDEVVLLPGEGALRAPEWVPWDQRVRPGDLTPGDLLPTAPDDTRLVPAYLDSDDPAEQDVAFELGMGRARVMSRGGRVDAAERWQSGARGPDTAMARQAPGRCGTCGYLLALAGALRGGFGVCGNEFTDSDGAVVSVEYGCGAHSDAPAEAAGNSDPGEVAYDDGEEIAPNR